MPRMGLFGLALVALLCAATARAENVLTSPHWSVSIEPERLAVIGRADGSEYPISTAREKPMRVGDLKADASHASWSLPDDGAAVVMRLDGDALLVEFKAEKRGTLTWPIVTGTPNTREYVLPMFEGLYVPSDDEPFAAFLKKESPMNTTAGLSMPFWGVDFGDRTLTYILTNPFNNEIEFDRTGERIGLKLTHEFTRNVPVKEFGFRIQLSDPSPVAPAKLFRKYLIDSGQFVSMRQKIEHTPAAAKLAGAAHIYLWGDGLIARKDVKDYKRLAAQIMDDAKAKPDSISHRIWELADADTRKALEAIPKTEFVDNFQKWQVVDAISGMLKRRDFQQPAPAANTDDVVVAKRNGEALHAAFSELTTPPETWGDGFSLAMVQALADAGIDRAWLGSPNWDGLLLHPEMVEKAKSLGYLIGPYDSYHSIHSPKDADTWETAQFDQALYDNGGIEKADGSKRRGFKQKGYQLSPAAARPAVEARVNRLMKQMNCNSWFIDCDAFGEVFDDYSPAHPMTQASDTAERLRRMKWISDTFGAVVGSEGGSAYAAPVIHFAHGMMTPVVAWGDPDLMKDKTSKYYLGAYYPPDAPAMSFKQVPMKPEHRRIYADPRFRIPLYEIVFHDSLVATHEWGYGSFKFDDLDRSRELLELLYNVPPLYHLNLAEWQKRKDAIVEHFRFFSRLHRTTMTAAMTDFRWLTADRMVQRTTFENGVEMTANFGQTAYADSRGELPPHTIWASQAVPGGALVTEFPPKR